MLGFWTESPIPMVKLDGKEGAAVVAAALNPVP